MTELVLHIGSHKTGTTSIQDACRRHLYGGKRPGVAYVDVRQEQDRIVRPRGSLDKFGTSLNQESIDRLFRPAADLTITSDETLFYIWSPKQIRTLARLLRPRFDRVRILAYLRRQDLAALSHRKQVAKGRPSGRFYGSTATPLPEYAPHLQRYFDYATKLADHWGKAFGMENMEVGLYDRRLLKDGDVVADFANRVGIALPPEDHVEKNTALGRDQLIVGLKLMEMGMPMEDRSRFLARLSHEGRFLPSRQEAQDFLAHFADSNRRLETLFRVDGKPFRFDESFGMYPQTNPSGWDDDSVLQLVGDVRHAAQPLAWRLFDRVLRTVWPQGRGMDLESFPDPGPAGWDNESVRRLLDEVLRSTLPQEQDKRGEQVR